MYQPNQYNTTSIKNSTIVITGVSCLLGLILVVATAILFSRVTTAPPSSLVEPVQVERRPKSELTDFPEGYSMMLPAGFSQESREETERGYIVYRFRSTEGYRLTLAIIPDESIHPFSSPPRDYSDALVGDVPELSKGIDGELIAERLTADGMAATLFRFYEKETYRPATFTFHMVAMDRGRKLVLRISGNYGGYYDLSEGVVWPDNWYASLVTLQHLSPSPQ